MAITVTHAKTVNIADDPKAAAAGEVLPSDWNANHVISGIVRDVLTANRNYYVSVTGSDSNGGTNSSTDAWATLQHAMNFIAGNLDIAGFVITVNIGAGSFAGFGQIVTAGGGQINWFGAGSASTTITAGPNDGVNNIGQSISLFYPTSTAFQVDKVTLQNNTADLLDNYGSGTIIYLGDVQVPSADVVLDQTGGSNTWVGVYTGAPAATIQFVNQGSFTAKGDFAIVMWADVGGLVDVGGTWTMSGSPTDITFASATLGGVVTSEFASGVSFGSITGQRFIGAKGGIFFVGEGGSDPTFTFFPGNSAGTIDDSSSYNTKAGGNSYTVSGLPPAATAAGMRSFVTDSTSTLAAGLGNIVTGSSSNATPVYSDGTNWRIG